MKSCVPLLLLVWLGLPRGGHAQEQIPCYSCRTSECPELDAPPCAGARAKPPKVRPPRPQHPPAPPMPPQKEAPATGAAPPSSPPAEAVPPSTPPTPPGAVPVELAPPVVSIEPPRPDRSLRRAALGVGIPGLLLAVGGVVLLAIDQRFAPADECWRPGDLTTCRQLYSTTAPGATLLAVGGGALIGAVVLFAVDARRASRPRMALRLPVPFGSF